jgi:hypothetical protein
VKILLSALLSLSLVSIPARALDGKLADEFPFVVRVLTSIVTVSKITTETKTVTMTRTRLGSCTGTVLDNGLVVTAAHCLFVGASSLDFTKPTSVTIEYQDQRGKKSPRWSRGIFTAPTSSSDIEHGSE